VKTARVQRRRWLEGRCLNVKKNKEPLRDAQEKETYKEESLKNKGGGGLGTRAV